jgi:tetratricopeptide (TPR) repeat protein
MILIKDLLGILAFRVHALRALADRRQVALGGVCFILGYSAYIFVRNFVYAVLPEVLSHPQGIFGTLLDLNLIQTFLFLLLAYVPMVIVASNAILGDGIGFSISRGEYQNHLAALLPVWGMLYLIGAPVQLLVPHFLIIGVVEISIGILVRSLLMFVYTLWMIKQLNYLSLMQAGVVCALSLLTFPLYYLFTTFLFALPIFFMIPLLYWGSQWIRGYFASHAGERVFQKHLSALTSNPQDADAHYQLGLVHLKRRSLDAARDYFASACRIRPQDPDYHYYLGRVYELKSEWKDALEEYEETYRLDPEYGLGDIFREVGKGYIHQGNFEKGMEFLKFFLSKRSSDPEGRYWMAIAMQKSGEIEQARFQLARILEQARSSPRFFRKQHREWIYQARNLKRNMESEA